MEIDAKEIRRLVDEARAPAIGPPKPIVAPLPRSQFKSDRAWLEFNARLIRSDQETEARNALFDLDFLHTNADIAVLAVRARRLAAIANCINEGRTSSLDAAQWIELDDAWRHEDELAELFNGSSLINYLKSNHANWRDMTPLKMFAISQERRAMALEGSFVQRMRRRMSDEPIGQ